ncbi:MAG: DUF4405 domain-containing protein [Chloroflexi bacterium]|nr:DUF4405 domain-containing protein [Chloroflexota bacterium]
MSNAIIQKTSKAKKRMSATKRNLIWDLGIGLGFLSVFLQDITGETLHEWLGLALFAGLITHVIFHWKWVVNITKRFFSAKLPRKTRINYLVNLGLAAAFVSMGVTGLMISESVMPAFGLGNGGELFEELHEAASNFTLLMVGTHLFMHWKWIWVNGKKYLFSGHRLARK